MTDLHPITPPPELVQQWRKSGPADAAVNNAYEQHIATQAARWGADMELEACCEWVEREIGLGREWGAELRTTRRPKPPSLAEKALEHLSGIRTAFNGGDLVDEPIRRALERLQELEGQGNG
jgi:hypothetical protein